MAEEIDNSIYEGEPEYENPEQEAAERDRQLLQRAMLPKFELAPGESFYITREQIAELNTNYFLMVKEMREGLNITDEVTRSYMESVLFTSYKSTIEKMQQDGEIKGKYEKKVYEKKKELLIPKEIECGWRGRKKWKNEAMKLCEKEAAIEAEIENSVRRETINQQKQYLDGDELPDTAWLIAYEFTTPKKYNRFIDRYRNYFTWLLTDYAVEHGVEEIYNVLVERFVKEKKREKFNERNEEYIKGLLIEYLRSFSEPEEESEAVPDSEESENVVEAPKNEQDAENGAVDGESADIEAESAAENVEQTPSTEPAVQSTGQTPARQEPVLKAQTDEDILNGLYGLYAVELNEKKKHAPQVITDPSRLLPFNVIILPYKISEETNGGGK